MISEQLQNRIAGLTGNSMAGMSQMGKGAISNKDIDMAMRALGLPDDAPISTQKKLQQLATANAMAIAQTGKGAISNKELEKYIQTMPNILPQEPVDPSDLIKNLPGPAVPLVENPRDLIQKLPSTPGAMSDLEMQLFEGSENMSPEDEQNLQELLQRAQQMSAAPLGQIAQGLAKQGVGNDTQLAHLRAGEVVLPPEFFEDEQFESAVEKKFNELGIDPEQAVVGTGVASLNPITGLEQFGFFKKLGKKLKKVVKKVAPIALPFILPGIGSALGVGAGAAGATTGLFGGTLGPTLKAGIGKFFNPATGAKGIFGGNIGPSIRRGIGSLGTNIFGGGQQETGDTGDIIGVLDGQPITKADYANLTTEQIMQIQPYAPGAQQTGIFGGTLGPRLRQRFLGTGDQPGIFGNVFGGGQQQEGGGGGLFGGGFGDALKMGGIGALAAGLGKLAYEDAKKQKGVPLTPLTTMSPTGRYNIEAEIARRMGQPAPNPVEFGLLPAGTIPELSGGKPRGMMYGGGVEDLTGGMVRGLANGGGVMAFAQGGAVQMQEGGEMDPNQFPRMDGDINGPGTETSDDIPAMLSDGEFVMTGRAVRGAGSYEMQADPNGIISLMPTLKENRERGMNLMYKMMDTFAGKAKASQ